MKHLAFSFLLLTLLISCSSVDKNTAKNITLIENYVTAVENMDIKVMGSFLAENYHGFGPSFGDSIGKKQALVNWKYNVENLYEKIEYRKSRNVAVNIATGDNQGQWVSNWAELDIHYKNGAGTVTIWANTNYQIENKKIVKSYTCYNEADALRQLGYVFINTEE